MHGLEGEEGNFLLIKRGGWMGESQIIHAHAQSTELAFVKISRK